MALLLLTAAVAFYFSLPEKLFNEPTSYVIEDRAGNLLNATVAADGQWRFPEVEEVPAKFATCLISFEDKRFYKHPGVDPIAMIRAMTRNIKSGQKIQGASTLTMQVARLSGKNEKRSIWNKIRESMLAFRIECSYTKNDILKLYASHAPFGSNVVGLDAAAWRYYGRPAEKLSWGESAALAVLPNAPAVVHPGKNRNTLLAKRNRLLDKLLQENRIDSTTCELSKLEPLPGKPYPLPQNALHLFQRFRKENKAGNPTIIQTTIDAALQKNVAGILQQHHNVLKGNGINNACAMIMEVETGDVLAYVGNIHAPGNREFEADVDVIAAPRSPGSALKPILYAAALHDGLILPQSLLPDVPTQIGGYSPKNFDLSYDGAVPADLALARSLNVPAVKLLQLYKYQRFYETLRLMGITTLNRPADNYGLSLVLGGSEVTMWDLAGLYASMARTLNHAKDTEGKVLSANFFPPVYKLKKDKHSKAANDQLPLDATSIYFTFQAMKEVMRPGEEGLWQQFSSSQTIAWKTGTSFGFRDGWAIGITPKYVVAVWTGNADGEGRPGLVGVHTAAPVLFDIFRLLPYSHWFSTPQNHFSFVPVCKNSGFRAGNFCDKTDTMLSPLNGGRSPLCPYHKFINLDATGTYRVSENCESPSNMQHRSWFQLPPSMEYYFKQKNATYATLPPFKPGCGSDLQSSQLEIIYPEPNSKIYVPLEISGLRGNTVFKATHRNAAAKLFWSIDDAFVATTQNFHQLELNPSPGKHLLTIVDQEGNSRSVWFEILDKEK